MLLLVLYGVYAPSCYYLCLHNNFLIRLFLRQRGLRNKSNVLILAILYLLFFMSTALWGLELAQLAGLNQILLLDHLGNLSTDEMFNRFYDLVARETKITGVLFQSQVCDRAAWMLRRTAHKVLLKY